MAAVVSTLAAVIVAVRAVPVGPAWSATRRASLPGDGDTRGEARDLLVGEPGPVLGAGLSLTPGGATTNDHSSEESTCHPFGTVLTGSTAAGRCRRPPAHR